MCRSIAIRLVLSCAACGEKPEAAEPSGRPNLHGNVGQDLLALGAATCQPGLSAADVGLVHLDCPNSRR